MSVDDNNLTRLVVSTRVIRLRIKSEPFVRFRGRSFIPAIRVMDIDSQISHILEIGAYSISSVLVKCLDEENDRLTHIEFSICKESDDKKSKYAVNIL